MKKQMIAIAILSAAVCLTGCTINVNDETMSAVKDTAVSMLDEAEIKVNGQPVEVSVDSDGDINVSLGKKTESTDNSAGSTNTDDAGQSQSTRPEETDIRNLVGKWHYQEQDPQNGAVYDDAGFVTVELDSTYTYQPANGSVPMHGTVRLDYEEYGNGDKVPFFAFYEDSGSFWNGIYCGHSENGIFYCGNGGTQRLVRIYTNEAENPFDEYIGTWQCDRCSIRIGQLGVVEIHWADSASEDNVWEYGCIYSEDGTYMECLGGGTLTHIVTAEDGTETRTEIYNDGTAKFSVRGGTLFWQDGKENTGMELGFTKIG